MADVRGMASVTYESVGSEDVTEQYYDSESRLSVYETKRDRMLALLKEATDMDAIIKLETELAQVNYEIERLTSALSKWNDLIDFSTIILTVRELPAATSSSGPEGFGERVGRGLTATLSSMGVFFESLLAFLIIASPVLMLAAVTALAVILLVRRRRRKKRAKAIQHRRGADEPSKEDK